MFVPLEVVDEISRYMRNRDLISMSLVCKHWHPTCTRHLSMHLVLSPMDLYDQDFQPYLDNFDGHEHHSDDDESDLDGDIEHHSDVPPHPSYVNSVEIKLDLAEVDEMDLDTDFADFYALLDHVNHIRRLELHILMQPYQKDTLIAVCREICVRLTNVKHLKLSCNVMREDDDYYDDYCHSKKVDPAIFERIMVNFRLISLTFEYDHPFNGIAMLAAQTATLVELDLPSPVLVHRTSGFRMVCFPRVKKLTLRPAGETLRDECVLDFGKVFPSLESLRMRTENLFGYDGEELGKILCMAGTSPRLKHLTLETSSNILVFPGALSITFQHLETLALHTNLYEEHLRLVASMHWPSLISLRYKSKSIYPTVMPHLLERTPRLKWLTASIGPDKEFLSGLVEMFGQNEWPNLEGVCILRFTFDNRDTLPKQVPTMQTACPNATFHLAHTISNSPYNPTYFHGVNVSPDRNRLCIKCRSK
jgi:hypothetical protein